MTTVINPAGYHPGKNGAGVELKEIDVGNVNREGQVFYGRKPNRNEPIWRVPGQNVGYFEKVYVCPNSYYIARSKQGILLNAGVEAGNITGAEAEFDGKIMTFGEARYDFSKTVTLTGAIPDRNDTATLKIEFVRHYGEKGSAVKQIELTFPEAAGFLGRFELKKLRYGSGGTEARVMDTTEGGLYVSKDTRCASESADYLLERLNRTRVYYLDDWKDRERVTGYFPENSNERHFRLRESLEEGSRVIFLYRRDRDHLKWKSNEGCFLYENTAFSDESLKQNPTGSIRIYADTENFKRRYISDAIPISLISNVWSGSGELNVGNRIRFSAGENVKLYCYSPDEFDRIGIYSLVLGGKIVLDDPTVFCGSAISLGNGNCFWENTVFPSKVAADLRMRYGIRGVAQYAAFDDGNLWCYREDSGDWQRLPEARELDALAARVAALEAK